MVAFLVKVNGTCLIFTSKMLIRGFEVARDVFLQYGIMVIMGGIVVEFADYCYNNSPIFECVQSDVVPFGIACGFGGFLGTIGFYRLTAVQWKNYNTYKKLYLKEVKDCEIKYEEEICKKL